jgi:hypothetical protein
MAANKSNEQKELEHKDLMYYFLPSPRYSFKIDIFSAGIFLV